MAVCCGLPPQLVVQEVKELLQQCWAPDPAKRPSFQSIVGVLEGLIARLPRREVLPGVSGGSSGPGSNASTPSSKCCSLQ